MNQRRLDFYIQELYEMLKLFYLDQFVEISLRRASVINLRTALDRSQIVPLKQGRRNHKVERFFRVLEYM
jgi:hypothetical protein